MNRLERGLGIQQPSTRLSRGLGISDPNHYQIDDPLGGQPWTGGMGGNQPYTPIGLGNNVTTPGTPGYAQSWQNISDRNANRNGQDQLISAMGNNIGTGPAQPYQYNPYIMQPGQENDKYAQLMQKRSADMQTTAADAMLGNAKRYGTDINYQQLYDNRSGLTNVARDKYGMDTANPDAAGYMKDINMQTLGQMGRGDINGWTSPDIGVPNPGGGNPLTGGVSGLDVLTNNYPQDGGGYGAPPQGQIPQNGGGFQSQPGGSQFGPLNDAMSSQWDGVRKRNTNQGFAQPWKQWSNQ